MVAVPLRAVWSIQASKHLFVSQLNSPLKIVSASLFVVLELVHLRIEHKDTYEKCSQNYSRAPLSVLLGSREVLLGYQLSLTWAGGGREFLYRNNQGVLPCQLCKP